MNAGMSLRSAKTSCASSFEPHRLRQETVHSACKAGNFAEINGHAKPTRLSCSAGFLKLYALPLTCHVFLNFQHKHCLHPGTSGSHPWFRIDSELREQRFLVAGHSSSYTRNSVLSTQFSRCGSACKSIFPFHLAVVAVSTTIFSETVDCSITGRFI